MYKHWLRLKKKKIYCVLRYAELSADGDDKIDGDAKTSSTDNDEVSGRRTLHGSFIIRKSLLIPTMESCGRDRTTPVLDRAAQLQSNVFDGQYFQARHNPLYSSDSEQLDDYDDQSW